MKTMWVKFKEITLADKRERKSGESLRESGFNSKFKKIVVVFRPMSDY